MKSDTTVATLQEKGFRITNARRQLIEIIKRSNSPLTVQELGKKLGKKGIAVNKSTIYREISFLIEQGIAAEIDFGDRKKRYESTHIGHHHHLICLKCSNIQDVTLKNELEDEEERIAKENKFMISHHSLEFFGFCNQCKP